MNAVVAEQEQSDVVEFRTPGPGERLRNARLSRDMEIGKLAGQLHLTVDMVEALECDDYSELPARVFVRGYLRNYARLVDIPVDSILGQFDELWPEDQGAMQIERAPRLPADQRPGRNWAGAVTWLLVIAGVVLFLMWWQGYLDRFAANGGAGQPASSEETETAVVSDAGLSVLPSAQPVAEQVEVVARPQLTDGPGLLTLPPAPASQVETAVPESAATQPEVHSAVQPAVAPASPAAEAPVTSETQDTPAEVPAAAVPETGVVVSFKEDCWVDIRGSERSFKLFGTMRKGTEKTLEGRPPYKFVLGNAEAVEIRVNGERFDLGAHTRDNVARFTLSP